MVKKQPFAKIMALSVEMLNQEVIQNKKVLLSFRFQKKTEGVKADRVKGARRFIAQCKTALNRKLFENHGGE